MTPFLQLLHQFDLALFALFDEIHLTKLLGTFYHRESLVCVPTGWGVEVFEANSGASKTVLGCGGAGFCVASGDGRFLVEIELTPHFATTRGGFPLNYWDTTTFALQTYIVQGAYSPIHLNHDGSMLVGQRDPDYIEAWHRDSGLVEPLYTHARDSGGAFLAIRMDDVHIVTFRRHSVCVWTHGRKSNPHKIPFTDTLSALELTHDRAVIGAANSLFVYCLSSQKVLHEVRKEHGVFTPLAISRSGSNLIAVAHQYYLDILDITAETGLKVVQIIQATHWIDSVAFSFDDNLLMYSTEKGPHIYRRLSAADRLAKEDLSAEAVSHSIDPTEVLPLEHSRRGPLYSFSTHIRPQYPYFARAMLI